VFRFLFEENTMKVRSWIGKNKCGSSAPQSREQKLEGVKNHLDNPGGLLGLGSARGQVDVSKSGSSMSRDDLDRG
jgi:hypothetical protein